MYCGIHFVIARFLRVFFFFERMCNGSSIDSHVSWLLHFFLHIFFVSPASFGTYEFTCIRQKANNNEITYGSVSGSSAICNEIYSNLICIYCAIVRRRFMFFLFEYAMCVCGFCVGHCQHRQYRHRQRADSVSYGQSVCPHQSKRYSHNFHRSQTMAFH